MFILLLMCYQTSHQTTKSCLKLLISFRDTIRLLFMIITLDFNLDNIYLFLTTQITVITTLLYNFP